MPNARLKPGETPEQARLRYNAEMRAYREKRAQQGNPLPNGSYDYKRERASRIKKQYGITIDQAESMLLQQGGVCAICSKPLSIEQEGKQAADYSHIDHCHTTGRVRGILCNNCNHGVGKFMDNPTLLRKAADYLALA